MKYSSYNMIDRAIKITYAEELFKKKACPFQWKEGKSSEQGEGELTGGVLSVE